METGMEIGQKIKRLREENALSQEEFAQKLNVTRQAVSKWESGRGLPDIGNIIAISEVFGMTVDELVKDAAVSEKLVADSAAKKWHILVMTFLVMIFPYIAYFAVQHNILMLGFGISTIFVLGIEIWIYFRKKVNSSKRGR